MSGLTSTYLSLEEHELAFNLKVPEVDLCVIKNSQTLSDLILKRKWNKWQELTWWLQHPIFSLSHQSPESSYFLLGTKGIPHILGETPFSCSRRHSLKIHHEVLQNTKSRKAWSLARTHFSYTFCYKVPVNSNWDVCHLKSFFLVIIFFSPALKAPTP